VPAGLGGPEPGPDGHLRNGTDPGISLYVQVRNMRESVLLAESLGGKLLQVPFEAPGPTTLCSILDPEGNRLIFVQQ
jgi:predicted enzyme related to lactoylglutathione lyase